MWWLVILFGLLVSRPASAQQSFPGYVGSLPIITPAAQAQVLVCPRSCQKGQGLQRMSLGVIFDATTSAQSVLARLSNAVSPLPDYVRSLPEVTSISDGYAFGSASGCSSLHSDMARFSQDHLHGTAAIPTAPQSQNTGRAASSTIPFAQYFCDLPLDAVVPALNDQIVLWSAAGGLQRISLGNLIGKGPAEVYYMTTGNDNNSCLTLADACATPQHAQQVVRGLLAQNISDVIVFGGPGTYRFSQTAEFDAEDSPQVNGHVIWTSLDHSNPAHWSGSKQVTGWSAVGGTNQYRAHLEFPPPQTPSGQTPDGTVIHPWSPAGSELHVGGDVWKFGAVNPIGLSQIERNNQVVGEGSDLWVSNGGKIFSFQIRQPSGPGWGLGPWNQSQAYAWQWAGDRWIQDDTQNGPPIDRVRELYVNDQHANVASVAAQRNWTSTINPALGGTASTWSSSQVTALNMASWSNLQDVELEFSGGWQYGTCPVQSVTGQAVRLQWPCEVIYPLTMGLEFGPYGSTPERISNARELLTGCTRCWYYDRIGKELYYVPGPSENMSTADVEVPVIAGLMHVRGAHDISFEHMVFEHSTWMQSPQRSAGYISFEGPLYVPFPHFVNWNTVPRMVGPLPPRDHPTQPNGIALIPALFGDTAKAGISVFESSNVNFMHDRMTGMSASELKYGINSRYSSAQANQFVDNPGGCVQVGQMYQADSTRTENTTVGIRINSNECAGPAFEYYGAAGIWRSLGSDGEINNNLITNTLFIPINLNFGWGDSPIFINYDNVVKNNRILGACPWWHDCGAIKTIGQSANTLLIDGNYSQSSSVCWYDDGGGQSLGAGMVFNTFWRGNVCQATAAYTNYVHSWPNITLENNWHTGAFYGWESGWGQTLINNQQFNAGSPPQAVTNIINASGPQNVTPGP